MLSLLRLAVAFCVFARLGTAQVSAQPAQPTYILGPGDELVIRALDVPEISDRPVRIDMQGFINLPMVGRVQAGGLSVEELEAELARRLRTYVIEPQVTVSITQFRSQPVSVLGAVGSPGVLQLEGRKTLFEVLSLAGGLRPDAGDTIRITRRKQWGRIPLPGAAEDATGQFWVAEVPVKAVMEAQNPEQNILVCPFDVITVPRAQMVYVIGSVRKPGGFVLGDKEILTALQALSLAEGLDRGAAPQNAKILRASQGSPTRTEIPIDLKRILQGKASDVPLGPEDILFVPGSTSKNLAYRSIEAMFAIGTGFAIYRGAHR